MTDSKKSLTLFCHALENRFLTILITTSAYPMRWFRSLHGIFYDVSKRAMSNSSKFVFLLLCLPCFHISNFFFKLSYLFQQRLLLTKSAECIALGGEDYILKLNRDLVNFNRPIELINSLNKLRSLIDTKNGALEESKCAHNNP